MTEKRNRAWMVLLILAVSLITASFSAVLLNNYHLKRRFELLGTFCGEVIHARPDMEQTILELVKETDGMTLSGRQNFLQTFGYRASDFGQDGGIIFLAVGVGLLIGGLLFFLAFWYWHRRSILQIKMLTDYLEKINTGSQGLLLEASEDDCSKLQDEIYKTVTTLYQTRDAAIAAKNNFADNLANIAHQLKTPITTLSLSVQMMEANPSLEYISQMKKQLSRLTYLEEALLLLSRIDAGTLSFHRRFVDVFTLLMLAADNLQQILKQAGVKIDIPEMEEIKVFVDLDWTMEAIMNLMKNCVEHSEEGMTVHCSCEENPLYVQIKIWDEGRGFLKEDMPHLFERFYRGKSAKKDSVGIGLSIAKEIIEMQNGILSANNLVTGGACFEIRLYSH